MKVLKQLKSWRSSSRRNGVSRPDSVGGLQVESLESRVLLSIAPPTAWDQYMLEIINLARSDPAAEAARYGIDLNEGVPVSDTISLAAKQPMAFNGYINDAAQGHSEWMLDNDVFSHTGASGSSPSERMTAAGYSFSPTPAGSGENIAYTGTTGPLGGLTGRTLELHGILFVDEDYPDRGHRTNMMNPNYNEIGVGVLTGVFTSPPYDYNSAMVTTDFAFTAGDSFLTGVVYDDGFITNDNFYTPGEGYADVTVTAVNQGDSSISSVETWDSGGYSLQLPAGAYDVTVSHATLGNAIFNDVTIGSVNVKLDALTTDFQAPEIKVFGNSKSISDGDSSPREADHTDFESVDFDGGTITRTFTIENTGDGPLSLTASPAVTITGANAADFTVVDQPDAVIAAGATTTFQVQFDPSAIGERTATVNFANDDSDENPFDFEIVGTGIEVIPVLPVVTAEAPDADAAEPGVDTGAFTVIRTGDTDTDLTISYTVTGTASSGADYNALSGSVTIPTGSSSALVTVTVIDDAEEEDTETVVLNISTSPDYLMGATGSATVNIADDDGPPTVTVVATDGDADETGLDTGIFTFSRTGDTDEELTVSYDVAGTATSDTDYSALLRSVTIPVGASTATATVTAIDDDIVEGAETVVVTVAASGDYELGATTSATVTIADDDVPPTVTIVATDADADETGPDTGTFTFSRTGDTDQALTVNVTISGGATNGTDYQTVSDTVVIPIGQTFTTVTVTPIDDEDSEPSETVAVNIAVDAAYDIGTPASATVTIGDDDGLSVAFGDGIANSVIYTDPSGATATISVKSGTGAVVFLGDVTTIDTKKGVEVTGAADASISSITVDPSSSSATLTVKANSVIAVDNITVNGSANSISGKNVSLGGDLTVSGGLAKLELLEVADQHVIDIGAGADSLAVKFGDVTDLTLNSLTPLKSLSVESWQDTDATADVITAPSLSKLSVRGDFAAGLSLTGALGSAKISGSITGGAWNISSAKSISVSGDYSNASLTLTQALQAGVNVLSKLSVKGAMDTVTVNSIGNLGKLSIARLIDSNIFAGVDSSVTGLPDDPADFTSAASIAGVKLNGKTAATWMANSNIAASELGKVSFGWAQTDNSDTDFGIACQKFNSISYKDASGAIKATDPIDLTQFDNLVDLVVRTV